VLEWDPVDVATASLRSLSLYRNDSKAGVIPRPTETLSTKISGLAVDTEYTFHLVLRTSAGTYQSKKLTVRTHKMTELSGITITPGIMPSALRESLQMTVEKIGAKIVDQVRIDTTHFVCTEGRGQLWERALELNVPVVVPDWVKGCEREGRIVGVRGYYLNADPRLRQVGPSVAQQQQAAQQQQQQQQRGPMSPPPTTEVTPPTPERASAGSSEKKEEEEESSEDDDSVRQGPPPPPPKSRADAPMPPPPAQDTEHKMATSPEEPKSRIDDMKPARQSEDNEDESDEESDEGTERASDDKAVEAGLPARSKPGASAAKVEDEGEFDEVAL
jgi:chitin biosynthesis protein CHS5